jgi:hypothetical protein
MRKNFRCGRREAIAPELVSRDGWARPARKPRRKLRIALTEH